MRFQRLGELLIATTFINVVINIVLLLGSLNSYVEERIYSHVFGRLFIDLDTIILYILPATEMLLMLMYVILTYILHKDKKFNPQMMLYTMLIFLFLLSTYIHLVVNYRH